MLIDYYSKWISFSFVDSPSTQSVLQFLKNVFSLEGSPKELVTDNGTHFVSTAMQNVLKDFDIQHLQVALHSPSANCLVERANRFLKEGIQTALSSHLDFKLFLKDKVNAYHNSPHSTTGFTPFELLRDRKCRTKLLPSWLERHAPTSYNSNFNKNTILRYSVMLAQNKQKLHYDHTKHVHTKDFSIGSWVLIKKPFKVKGESSFTSPCKIEKVGISSCLLQDKGWWNKDRLVPISNEQAVIHMKTAVPSYEDNSILFETPHSMVDCSDAIYVHLFPKIVLLMFHFLRHLFYH